MRRRILIVEDDPATQLLLRRMVAKVEAESRVDCAPSAEDAYWALNAAADADDPFDMAIADLCLPGSDGLELWKTAQKHHPAVDFLFISGTTYAEWENRIERLPEWPNFLRKPVTEEALKTFFDMQFHRTGEMSG